MVFTIASVCHWPLLLVAILPRLIELRNMRRCKDNIKMGLQEVGWVDMDWIDLAQDKDR